MNGPIDRRQFMQIAALGGVVFASGLRAADKAQAADYSDFYFVQLSDTHWGFEGAPNPDARGTLGKAVKAVNALAQPPDFVVFTGDLTHTTFDGKERRARMAQFKQIVSELKVKDVRFLPGEHDASLDKAEAFQEFFGKTHYSFDHKGVHFIAIDNVSILEGAIGDDQLSWLQADLATQSKQAPICVLTHRPLFDLYSAWGWSTKDGARAIELLMPYPNVTVFYGHIHQENHQMTGHIPHHAAKSLIFPLPAPGSSPDHKPLAWDPSAPYRGMGWRGIEVEPDKGAYQIQERPMAAT